MFCVFFNGRRSRKTTKLKERLRLRTRTWVSNWGTQNWLRDVFIQ